MLYGEDSAFSSLGVNNWNNANKRIKEHDNSSRRHKCATLMKDTAKTLGPIDKSILLQFEQVTGYWKKILKRGHSFWGQNEEFDFQHNGNYLMSL